MVRDVMGLFGAVQFLTRLPVRTPVAPDLSQSAPWFPLVGAVIGGALGGLAAGLAQVVPMSVAAAVAVLTGVLVTGAFHEDGLADVADAFGGGWTREQRFEIMKDSLHGSYGVASLTGSIVLRIVCVASLSPSNALAGLVAAHTLGRAGSVGAMAAVRPATPGGLGADSARGLRPRAAVMGLSAAVAITALVCGWWVMPLAAAACVGAIAASWLALRKIGGITGDVLGAIEQVGEVLVLVVMTGLATRHHLWWDR